MSLTASEGADEPPATGRSSTGADQRLPSLATHPDSQSVTSDVDHTHGDAAPSGAEPGASLLSDQTNRLPTKQTVIVFLGCASALIIGQLDQIEVSTAIPSISQDLGGGSHSSWIAAAYLLTATVTLPLVARMSDIFGRKNALQASLVLFSIGNIACGSSQTMSGLIISRGVAGAGGGAILTCAQIIVCDAPNSSACRVNSLQINDVVAQRERGRYQGLLSAASIVSSTTGGLLGAVFTERLSWRYIFWLALPLTVISSVIIQLFLPLRGVSGHWRKKIGLVDYIGAWILMTSLTLLCLALNWGGVSFAWSSRQVMATLICGITGATLFIIWEQTRWARLPLLPMRVFRFSTVSGVAVTMFLNGAAFYTQLFYGPAFFQIVLGYSPIKSGIVLIPISAATVFCSLFCGVLVSKTGIYKPVLLISWVVWTVGLGLVSTISISTPLSRIIGYWMVAGLGFGPILSTSLIAATNVVSRPDQAPVAALRNLSRQMGGTVFLAGWNHYVRSFAGLGRHVALMSSLAVSYSDNTLIKHASVLDINSSTLAQILDNPRGLTDGLPQLSQAQRFGMLAAYRNGWQTICYILIGFTSLAFFISLVFIKQVELQSSTKEERAKAAAWLKERKQKRGQGPEVPAECPPTADIELESRSVVSAVSVRSVSRAVAGDHVARPAT